MEKKHVLVVEDEPLHIEIYTHKLEEAGYTVAAARDEHEVQAALREKKPDLILLDILLPGKSGLEILEELRGKPEYHDTPVIVFTNFDDLEYRERAKRLKVSAYVVKANTTPDEIVRYARKELGEPQEA